MEKKSTYFLRLAGMILGSTLVISLLILLIGYIYLWNEPVEFSNAFLIVGAIIIVLGSYRSAPDSSSAQTLT